MQGAHALVRGNSSASNHIIARCVEFFHMSSGWLELYTPCNACIDEGSRRFNALELPRTSTLHTLLPLDVLREGSVHPELMLKNSTHLAICAMMWFEKVQGGSMRLNYPKLVHKHLAFLLKMYLEKVRYTPNSC